MNAAVQKGTNQFFLLTEIRGEKEDHNLLPLQL